MESEFYVLGYNWIYLKGSKDDTIDAARNKVRTILNLSIDFG